MSLKEAKKIFKEFREKNKQISTPEEHTKLYLIEPLFKLFGYKVISRETQLTKRRVDYVIENKKVNKRFFVEAKPHNKPLNETNVKKQCMGIFKEFENNKKLRRKYETAIGTNGKEWFFIYNYKKESEKLDIIQDFNKIKNLMLGKILLDKKRKEITDKFYKRYLNVLHKSEDSLLKNITLNPELPPPIILRFYHFAKSLLTD